MKPLTKDAEKYKNLVVVVHGSLSDELWYSRPGLKQQGYTWQRVTKYSRHPIVLKWLKNKSKPKVYR